MLLPETDLAGAGVVANRIVETLHAAAIMHPGLVEGGIVTASLGVARGPADGGWKVVLDNADRALYVAKSAGRDQVAYEEARDVA